MTRQILVALDGSTLSESALPCAAAMARRTASALLLMRCVPPLAYLEPAGGAIPPSSEFWEAREEEPNVARDYLMDVAKSLRADALSVQTLVEEGDPATCILDQAARNPDIEMIVMATHARSGLGRWIFGSVAERVLHSSAVPVLLVRSQKEGGKQQTHHTAHPYHTILVPLDGSSLAEQALVQVHMLAAATKANIVLLSVVPTPGAWELTDGTSIPVWVEQAEEDDKAVLGEYLAEIAKRLETDGIKVRTQVELGNPAEEITLTADRLNADLIVMASHGRSGLPRLWIGSVAMKVVQGTTRPVLLVRARKQAGQPGDAHEENEEKAVSINR